MAEPLTSIERRVYHYLLDFLAANTFQPSIREIAKKFRIKSTKTVSDILQALAEKGYIQRDRSRSRGVRLLGYATVGHSQPIPFYGRINAGEPALLPEHREGYITVDRRFIPTDDSYFLKVRGDSMIGRGIVEGDYVLVSPSTEEKDGDVIAARLGEEATIKTLKHHNGTIVLVAANPDVRDIEIGPDDDFAVLGVVSGVFRPFCDQPEPAALEEEES